MHLAGHRRGPARGCRCGSRPSSTSRPSVIAPTTSPSTVTTGPADRLHHRPHQSVTGSTMPRSTRCATIGPAASASSLRGDVVRGGEHGELVAQRQPSVAPPTRASTSGSTSSRPAQPVRHRQHLPVHRPALVAAWSPPGAAAARRPPGSGRRAGRRRRGRAASPAGRTRRRPGRPAAARPAAAGPPPVPPGRRDRCGAAMTMPKPTASTLCASNQSSQAAARCGSAASPTSVSHRLTYATGSATSRWITQASQPGAGEPAGHPLAPSPPRRRAPSWPGTAWCRPR